MDTQAGVTVRFIDVHYRTRKFKLGKKSCTTKDGIISASDPDLIEALEKQYGIQREGKADADTDQQTETN